MVRVVRGRRAPRVALVAPAAGCAEDLGVTPGGGTSRADDVSDWAINATGTIVGWSLGGDVEPWRHAVSC